MTNSTDRIEKEMLLKATPARVWRALSVAEEFGTWFGVSLGGQTFAPGQSVQGTMDGCGHADLTMHMHIEQMEPERLFSYRWHPYAIDPVVDYSQEPTTLVEFHLEPAEGGTRLRVIETGFDQVPEGRRAIAFAKHTQGWETQLKDISEHVANP